VEWSKDEIRLAYRHVVQEAKTHKLKVILENYSKSKFGKIYTFFSL